MEFVTPKYFDYLETYGTILESKLAISELRKINLWRKQGLDDLNAVVTGCRRIIETILKDDSTISTSLDGRINDAKIRKEISKSYRKKFDEIRKIGNRGAHDSIKRCDAERSMILLDEILRKYIYELKIDQTFPYTTEITDTIFIVETDAKLIDLENKAKNATLLSGDDTVEKEVSKLKENIEEQNRKSIEVSDFINRMLAEISSKVEELELDQKEAEDAYVELDKIHSLAKANLETTSKNTREINDRVDDILKEHDFIMKLLRGKGYATEEQAEVIAFPKTSNTTTNILQISGGPGTGKTLCLLAKLIRDIEDNITENEQTSFLGNTYKKALFVCFNRELAGYVSNLRNNYPKMKGRIDIISLDQYIYQLVRATPSDEFLNLRDFAKYLFQKSVI